jgi:hypothetical protein
MQEKANKIVLPQGVRDACAKIYSAEHPAAFEKAVPKAHRVARLPFAVDALNAIAANLPDPYHWRFITAEAFAAEFEACEARRATSAEINGLYWRDTLATIEAHSVMAAWRMIDIAQSSLQLVESEAVVPAAILARSALESAIQFVYDSGRMSGAIDEVSKLDLSTSIVSHEVLEAVIVQTVYASRQSDSDPIYKSKNILTVIEKIAKLAEKDPIASEYELLCELTHPNFLGRSVHVVGIEPKTRPGDELRLISHRNGLNSDALLLSAFWALSWSIEAQASSFLVIQNAIGNMITKFPFLETKRAG